MVYVVDFLKWFQANWGVIVTALPWILAVIYILRSKDKGKALDTVVEGVAMYVKETGNKEVAGKIKKLHALLPKGANDELYHSVQKIKGALKAKE
jgi:hypothetical protein